MTHTHTHTLNNKNTHTHKHTHEHTCSVGLPLTRDGSVADIFIDYRSKFSFINREL